MATRDLARPPADDPGSVECHADDCSVLVERTEHHVYVGWAAGGCQNFFCSGHLLIGDEGYVMCPTCALNKG